MISFGHCKRTAVCADCQVFSRMCSSFLLSRELDCFLLSPEVRQSHAGIPEEQREAPAQGTVFNTTSDSVSSAQKASKEL